MEPLPPWPEPDHGPEEGLADGAPGRGPQELQVARWLLDLGGSWHLCGRTLMERHLVRTPADLPEEVSALLGARLPADDPRTDVILERLAEVEVCRGLQQLDLARTAVGAAGLRTVARFPWLQGLDLSNTQVALEDLQPLKALPELSRLELAGTPMGHLEHGDLFGQVDVPSGLRHPVGALQRGLGRWLDLTLVGLGLALLETRAGDPLGTLELSSGLRFVALPALAAGLLVPLEALLLSLIGRTPGKALMNVVVVTESGGRPGLLASVKRALGAWITGLGLGLRPLSWGLAGLRLFQLASGQTAAWDRWASTRPVPRHCAGWRVLLAPVLLAAAFVLRRELA